MRRSPADGFFAKTLEKNGINVVIPKQEERKEMERFHDELMQNIVTQKSIDYFKLLIEAHHGLDALVLGCTEYPLVIDQKNSMLPVIDPVVLQVANAVDYSLNGAGR